VYYIQWFLPLSLKSAGHWSLGIMCQSMFLTMPFFTQSAGSRLTVMILPVRVLTNTCIPPGRTRDQVLVIKAHWVWPFSSWLSPAVLLSKMSKIQESRQRNGIERKCRVHRRHLHKRYPIVLPYPRAILCGLSYSCTSTFLSKIFRRCYCFCSEVLSNERSIRLSFITNHRGFFKKWEILNSKPTPALWSIAGEEWFFPTILQLCNICRSFAKFMLSQPISARFLLKFSEI